MRKFIATACVCLAMSACCSSRYIVADEKAAKEPVVAEVEYGALTDIKTEPCAYSRSKMAVTVTGNNVGYDERVASYKVDWYDADGVLLSKGKWNKVAVPGKSAFKWVNVAGTPYAAGYKVYVKQGAPTKVTRDRTMAKRDRQIKVRREAYPYDDRKGCRVTRDSLCDQRNG